MDILGVPVDRLDMIGSLARIEAFIASGKPHRHVVVNASKLVMLDGDAGLFRAVRSCDLVNADGQSSGLRGFLDVHCRNESQGST